jgi:hypothetical protein
VDLFSVKILEAALIKLDKKPMAEVRDAIVEAKEGDEGLSLDCLQTLSMCVPTREEVCIRCCFSLVIFSLKIKVITLKEYKGNPPLEAAERHLIMVFFICLPQLIFTLLQFDEIPNFDAKIWLLILRHQFCSRMALLNKVNLFQAISLPLIYD